VADILLLGLTHFPRLRMPDEQWNKLFLKMLSDPALPSYLKDPSSWPEGLRREWADDQGLRAAQQQRKALMADFRIMRQELERFQPDFILVWGDDQYENFQDDGIPPFAVLAYDSIELEPWKLRTDSGSSDLERKKADNPPRVLNCHREGAKYITSSLLTNGFDVTYCYKPRHVGLGHAFLNVVLYLDEDRKGFPWKMVPFSVNCYGRIVVAQKGFPKGLSEAPTENWDPPSPQPWRCFDLGAACARAAKESKYRIALVASSSWSHAFMTRKNYFLFPDMDADKQLYADLVAGRYSSWRERTLAEIEDSGQAELLNWACLAGAFDALGLKPRYSNFHESYLFNSPKVFVVGAG
jgi:hypothetical protein